MTRTLGHSSPIIRMCALLTYRLKDRPEIRLDPDDLTLRQQLERRLSVKQAIFCLPWRALNGDACNHSDSESDSKLIEEGRLRQQQQVAEALGCTADNVVFRGFVSAYCSSLVHDVNAVHGMLDRMGVADVEVGSGELFALGDGGSGTVGLLGGQALWHMVHLTVPHLADYRERIGLYFDDFVLELIFPSPWLNHQPTELLVRRSEGLSLTTKQIRVNFEEAYVRELEGFWSSIIDGAPVRNTVEHALRDQQLLCALTARAIAATPSE